MPLGHRPLGAARALIAAIAASAMVAAPACGENGVPKGLSKDQLFGTTLRKAKWDRLHIEVCWDNATKIDAAMQETVKVAVADSWEKVSAVRFTGWMPCASADAPGLHVVIDGDQPWTEAVGRYLDMRPAGMHLNLNVATWRPQCAADPQKCIRAVVVHEFGHALGFTHEQVKAGVPAECSSEPKDIIGDYLVTKYDPSSVMSLCNTTWNGDGRLSALDVQAVRRFYSA